MKQGELYRQLVDLYVGDELPEELAEDLQATAFGDPALAKDIKTLRQTLSALRNIPRPSLEEDSYYRVLCKLYSEGATPSTRLASASSQYQLPMSG